MKEWLKKEKCLLVTTVTIAWIYLFSLFGFGSDLGPIVATYKPGVMDLTILVIE